MKGVVELRWLATDVLYARRTWQLVCSMRYVQRNVPTEDVVFASFVVGAAAAGDHLHPTLALVRPGPLISVSLSPFLWLNQLTSQAINQSINHMSNNQPLMLQWDLVCDRAHFAHLATTVYYCGVMLGCFVFGYLSDYLGRRPVVLATLAGATVLGTGLAFVRHFPMFLALRFVLGFLTQVGLC